MSARIRTFMGVAFAVLALVACRDEMPDMQDPRANTDIYNWSQLFDCYWTGMNYNYVFWDIDPTDWDAVYDEYKPRFDALADKGFGDKAVNNEAFGLLEELSSGLIDGHFSVSVACPDTTYFFFRQCALCQWHLGRGYRLFPFVVVHVDRTCRNR